MRPFDRREHQRGRAIIEMALATTILASMTMPVALAEKAGFEVFKEVSIQSVVSTKNRRAIDKIVEAVSSSSLDSVSSLPESPYWYDMIQVAQLTGTSATTGDLTWRSAKLKFTYAPNDPNDGVDNDGDGLVDEGTVVLIQNYGTSFAKAIVLCSNVREYLEGEIPNGQDDNGNGLIDEKGLCFSRHGEKLLIQLSVVAKRRDDTPMVQTMKATVGLRN